jgi:hypothetical protein
MLRSNGVAIRKMACWSQPTSHCIFGAPEEIRTPDPLVRSQVLYPAELRARFCEVAHYIGVFAVWELGFCFVFPWGGFGVVWVERAARSWFGNTRKGYAVVVWG